MLLNPYGEIKDTLWGLNQPISVATGSDGSIYIGSAGKGSVAIYNADLQLQRKLGSGDGEFKRPSDLVVDSANNVYVVDSKKHAVNIYLPDGSLKTSFGSLGTTPGLFTTPVAIALNEAAAEIIVSDLAMISSWAPSARIQVFDLNGIYKRSFYTLVNDNGYLRPFAVAVDELNRIYVADAFQNSVTVYDSDGVALGVISDPLHPFRTPMGLSYSAAKSRLFVASLSSAKLDVVAIDSFDPTLDVRNDSGTLLGDSYDFGTVWIGRDSDPKQTIITNNGNSNLVISSVTFSNNSSAEFAIPDGSDSCSNQTLAPFSSCTISVTFSPTSEGSKTAQLNVASNAIGAPITSTTLHGTSIQQPQHSVTVVINSGTGGGNVLGTGINCGADCSKLYGEESSVTLNAVADAGSVFAGWSGAGCSGVESCLITLTQDEIVTATFSSDSAPTYVITASSTANGSISPAGLLELDEGSNQTYHITPDSDFQIKALLIDGLSIATTSSYTFSDVSDNHTIAVEFETAAPLQFTFESGVVTETDSWVPIVFSRSFTSPIVVA
ncbi:MAG: choice-of-anchor D domain-containing protein, partial [Candidatus Polarisedimenticolaceae bacterium]|nr:choice-of-anchor D domain-containing protein [Candidatus Polarisedimenticolaceae bacterium]